MATSGAVEERSAPARLRQDASHRQFHLVLVDDLSRLARSTLLVLLLLEELRFEGVRVVSVTDGLQPACCSWHEGLVERESAAAYGFPSAEGAMSSTPLSAFMSTGFTMW